MAHTEVATKDKWVTIEHWAMIYIQRDATYIKIEICRRNCNFSLTSWRSTPNNPDIKEIRNQSTSQTAHPSPSPSKRAICDELGILIRHMGESRFFILSRSVGLFGRKCICLGIFPMLTMSAHCQQNCMQSFAPCWWSIMIKESKIQVVSQDFLSHQLFEKISSATKIHNCAPSCLVAIRPQIKAIYLFSDFQGTLQKCFNDGWVALKRVYWQYLEMFSTREKTNCEWKLFLLYLVPNGLAHTTFMYCLGRVAKRIPF